MTDQGAPGAARSPRTHSPPPLPLPTHPPPPDHGRLQQPGGCCLLRRRGAQQVRVGRRRSPATAAAWRRLERQRLCSRHLCAGACRAAISGRKVGWGWVLGFTGGGGCGGQHVWDGGSRVPQQQRLVTRRQRRRQMCTGACRAAVFLFGGIDCGWQPMTLCTPKKERDRQERKQGLKPQPSSSSTAPQQSPRVKAVANKRRPPHLLLQQACHTPTTQHPNMASLNLKPSETPNLKPSTPLTCLSNGDLSPAP